MKNSTNTLENLGYDNWFSKHADADKTAMHELARVVAVHKDSYIITRGNEDVFAEPSGRLLYDAYASSDMPTTGDWVYADFYDADSHAILHGVLPRKTVLQRKTAGKSIDFQLIAANIDTAFIVQSVDGNLNLRRLERYLVIINEAGITPVILLSKCDLLAPDDMDAIVQDVLSIAPLATVVPFSNVDGTNIDTIQALMLPAHTYCLLGSSGVGKTSLLNTLLGRNRFETQPVSTKHGKGKHTTTSRELIALPNGAFVVDTPGMRELGTMAVDDGLDDTFSEIQELADQCRFGDCSHINEKGCAILEALSAGELSEKRYRNYLKMKKEAEFYDMSYVDKRKKDKAFKKHVRAFLKEKEHRKHS